MKNAITPSHMIIFGVCAMFGAGFFTIAHVGSAKREIRGMEYGFGTRKAPEPPPDPGLVASFKRGAETLADKAGAAVHDFFSWGDSGPAGTVTASADQPAGEAGEGADEKDPFEDFYNRNYSKGSGSSASYGGSSGGSFGGGSFGGGSWGGSSATSGRGSGGDDDGLPAAGGSGAKAAPAKSDGDEAEAGRAPRANRPVVENAEGEWVKKPFNRKGAAGEKLASLPGGPGGPLGGLERAGDLSGGAVKGAGGSGGQLSDLPGQKGKVDLNGADEKAASGAQSSYNSKMSGGAAAAASAGAAAAGGGGGGGVPAASGPKEVGSDDKDKKGKDEKGKDEKAASDSGYSAPPRSYTPPASPRAGAVTASAQQNAAEEEPDFLRALLAERQKGAESTYVTVEEAAAAAPREAQLRSGALIRPASLEKASLLAEDEEKPAEKPDPEKFAQVTADRKKEIKKEVLLFLRGVENKHGASTDIFYTPCSKAKEVCSDNGLKMGFITMHTADGARVQVSLKYAEKKWTPYTVSFGTTVNLQQLAPKPAPQPEDPPDEEPDEGGDDDGLVWV